MYKNQGLPRIDLTGNQFGYLTVISFSHINKFGVSMWNTICKCGKTKIASSNSMKNGQTTSCGCRKAELITLPFGQAMSNRVFESYINGANKRGLSFSLSRNEFDYLTSQKCFYCGCEPQTVAKARHHSTNGDFVYNGIDRIDSKKGYEIDNIVPCCTNCNLAKRDMSYEDFITWLSRVSSYINPLKKFGGKHANRISVTYMRL